MNDVFISMKNVDLFMFIVILAQNKFVSTVEITPNNLIILHDHNFPKSVYK